MADWIIPCNPDYYDIAGSFEKLDSVDWRQTVKSIMPGDTVYLYVGRPVQAIAFTYVVTKTMIPSAQADSSDEEFNKGSTLEPYPLCMRLKPVSRIPLNILTFDKMRRAGLLGNIQGPRLVPEELREMFDEAQRVAEPKIPVLPEAASRESDPDDRENITTEKYDTERFMHDMKCKKELDPNLHDGSYIMMRNTVTAYSHLRNDSELDYRDLNLIYLTTVGTWKHGIEAKKKNVDESHLSHADKVYLKNLWDEIWQRAGENQYSNIFESAYPKQSIGMFGTGFFTFQNKTTSKDVREFIAMCVDILPMEDEGKMFARAERVFTGSMKGMQAASASMVLHCLKPFVFPILNSMMGHRNVYEVLGVPLSRTYYLDAYIDNCRKIKKFRDQNFTFRNYRILDMAAWDAEKYLISSEAISIQTQKRPETVGNPEKSVSVETEVDKRVREEFMRQIREKKAELADLDMKRENIRKEISLLENMLARL